MSNLSDLLPAGASAKSITATDSGSGIAINTPVILETAGTVTQVAIGPSAVGEVGAAVVFNPATNRVDYVATTFDSDSNKVVIAYGDATNSFNGYGVVGTVSGTSISYGTPVVFETGGSADHISCTFDSNSNKVVIVYRDNANSMYGTAIVGTVSGTAISYGTAVVFESATTSFPATTFDSNENKVVIAYQDGGNSSYGTAIVGTVSGTSISFGTAVVFNAAASEAFGATFDSNENKVVISYGDAGNSYYGTAVVVTITGTVPSFGSEAVFESASTDPTSATFDSNSNKVVIAYRDKGNSNHGTGVVGTVSGTSISFGTPVVFEAAAITYPSATFDSNSNKVVIAYTDYDNSNYGTVIQGTVSGTAISYGTALVFNADTTTYNAVTFDSDSNNAAIAYGADAGTGDSGKFGKGIVYSTTATNLTATNFLGFADEAISASASGVIVVQGGTATYPAQPALNAGDPVQFESGSNTYNASVFDSNANKIVAFYDDIGNSNYGTAAVGTVSGMTSTWGTPVVFNSANSSFIAAAFDSDANKTVTVYRDAGNSSYGTAIVGTVSGTSISFGTEADFNAASTTNIGIGFDSTANKVVVAFRDDGNSDYGTAVVGTVSGTGISFGAEATFQTNQTSNHQVVYDPDENKTVLAYKHVGNSDYGTSNVCTVTGTSISIGADVIFKAASTDPGGAVYDTTADKVVIAYSISGAAKAIVGTVSGTSISYGTEAEFASTSTSVKSAAFDSTANEIMVAFVESVTTFDGWCIAGTVSGTSISFGTALNFTDPNNANNIATAYDSNADRTVFTYKDSAESDGRAVVLSATTTLTIGSNYYVQPAGTLATSAGSPSVKAGLAISTTSLLLSGDS